MGDMFQRKLDELLSGIPNVFGTADEILIAGFDKNHDETLQKALHIYRQTNLKLNKHICLFTFTRIPFFGGIISWQDVNPD